MLNKKISKNDYICQPSPDCVEEFYTDIQLNNQTSGE